MSTRRARRLLPALLLATAGLGACQAIAGIEDRKYEATDATVPPSAACVSYCSKLSQVCNTDTTKQYETNDECLGICAHLPPGDPLEPGTTNTLACRAAQADHVEDCAAAGPGGNGSCGSNCESFCALQAAICPPGEADCVAQCAGLPPIPNGAYSAMDESGDSLGCRLYHVSAASVLPSIHCAHATLRPNGPCVDPANTPPNCDNFCKLEMTACRDHVVYPSLASCKAVCQALPQGSTNDQSQNTAGCRYYHSYNAQKDPVVHCSHTGPGGDGHCGLDDPTLGTGNCVSYCTLLAQACSAEYAQTFPSDAGTAASMTDCVASCGSITGANANSGYTITPVPTGANLQCRLFHTAAALLAPNDATECAAAFGGGVCN